MVILGCRALIAGATMVRARGPGPGTMARAPIAASLAGFAGHVLRTAAGVIKWLREARNDAEAWKSMRGLSFSIYMKLILL